MIAVIKLKLQRLPPLAPMYCCMLWFPCHSVKVRYQLSLIFQLRFGSYFIRSSNSFICLLSLVYIKCVDGELKKFLKTQNVTVTVSPFSFLVIPMSLPPFEITGNSNGNSQIHPFQLTLGFN